LGLNSSHTHEVLKRIELKIKRLAEALENLRPRFGFGGSTGSNVEVNIDTSALAQEITLQLIRDSQIQIDANTDPIGGMTIAEWLQDIEADVDGIESRLDDIISELQTLITANAANFALNIAEMGIQTTLNIAAIVANAATTVAGIVVQTISLNSSLGDVEDAIDAGNIIAQDIEDVLDTIKVDTQAIENAVEEIEVQLVSADSGVDATTISGLNTDYRMRPDDTDGQFQIHAITVTNRSAFPNTFRLRYSDGTTIVIIDNSAALTVGLSHTFTLAAGQGLISNGQFLEINTQFNGAHEYETAFIKVKGGGSITFSSPT